MLAVLVMVGLLVQGCSDNNGRVTPTTASTTGFAVTSAAINIQLAINPNSIAPGQEAGVTALVTNANGQPLAGKKVQFSTSVGSLSQTVVTTNASGQASTTLRVSAADVANAGGGSLGAGAGAGGTVVTVTAFVEGAVGTGQVSVGGVAAPPAPPVPAALTLLPETVPFAVNATGATPGTCALGALTATFFATGGVPPYTFQVSGSLGGSISEGGVYNAPAVVVTGGFNATDNVILLDSTGAFDTSTVTVTCVPVAP